MTVCEEGDGQEECPGLTLPFICSTQRPIREPLLCCFTWAWCCCFFLLYINDGIDNSPSEYARERKEHMKEHPTHLIRSHNGCLFSTMDCHPSLSPPATHSHTTPLIHSHTNTHHTHSHTHTTELNHFLIVSCLPFCSVASPVLGFRQGASSSCLVSCLHWIYRFLVGRTDLCVQEPSMFLYLFKFSFKVWSFFSCGSCCNCY